MSMVIHESAIGPAKELKQKIRDGYANDPFFATQTNIACLEFRDGLYYRGHQMLVPHDDAAELHK